jgi:hypothetical protein
VVVIALEIILNDGECLLVPAARSALSPHLEPVPRLQRGDSKLSLTHFSRAQGDKVDLEGGVSFPSAAGNVATLSDSSIITAQVGFVWIVGDFI